MARIVRRVTCGRRASKKSALLPVGAGTRAGAYADMSFTLRPSTESMAVVSLPARAARFEAATRAQAVSMSSFGEARSMELWGMMIAVPPYVTSFAPFSP